MASLKPGASARAGSQKHAAAKTKIVDPVAEGMVCIDLFPGGVVLRTRKTAALETSWMEVISRLFTPTKKMQKCWRCWPLAKSM